MINHTTLCTHQSPAVLLQIYFLFFDSQLHQKNQELLLESTSKCMLLVSHKHFNYINKNNTLL